MSPLGLFVMGVLVTLFYGAGLSLLVYGAMLDGRDEERRKAEEAERAAQAGARTGCRVITLSGFGPDNPLRRLGEVNFYLPSDSYGFVEITHLAICHCILDTIIAARG
jgi:hypothetical protein